MRAAFALLVASVHAPLCTTSTLVFHHDVGVYEDGLGLAAEGNLEHLTQSPSDARYLGLALDEGGGHVYVSTGQAVQRLDLNGENKVTVAEGWKELTVQGFHLTDPTHVSVRGVPCNTIASISSTRLVCITAHPAITVADADPVNIDDITVTTVRGGEKTGGYDGAFIEARLAEANLEPIVTAVTESSREFAPAALAFDANTSKIYWSNSGSSSIERSNPDGGELEVVLQGSGMTSHGMAITPSSLLYFTDSQAGTLSSLDLTTAEASPNAIVSGLAMPMGIALELEREMIYVAQYTGVLAALDLTDMSLTEVVRLPTHVRLDGVALRGREALADHNDGIVESPWEQQLWWSESGLRSGITGASIAGLHKEAVVTDEADQVLWPRALARSTSGTLYFTE
ncbi:unnamed protein product [Chrysoparadoxa australica]